MSNLIIPYEHQSAPTLKYDPVLAREHAERQDKKEKGRKDWDKFDWEMHHAGHDDPGIALLRRPEKPDGAWTDQNLEMFADNYEAAERQRWENQEEWQGKENEEARLTNILYPDQVMRKLRKAGVDARTDDNPRGHIWLNDWSAHGLVGVNAWVKPQEMSEEGFLEELRTATGQKQKDLITANYYAALEGRKIMQTLTSLQSPGPEYSIMRFNERNIPTNERYRGWRTALLVLIIADVITEEQVNAAFGPAIGIAGVTYRRRLKAFRQVKMQRALTAER